MLKVLTFVLFFEDATFYEVRDGAKIWQSVYDYSSLIMYMYQNKLSLDILFQIRVTFWWRNFWEVKYANLFPNMNKQTNITAGFVILYHISLELLGKNDRIFKTMKSMIIDLIQQVPLPFRWSFCSPLDDAACSRLLQVDEKSCPGSLSMSFKYKFLLLYVVFRAKSQYGYAWYCP